jgi:hypothetical protein
MVRYESLLTDPDSTLRQTCASLGLEWHRDMVVWPKPLSRIAYISEGLNSTFAGSLARPGIDVSAASRGMLRAETLPVEELDWLEGEFAEYNAVHGYPSEIPRGSAAARLPEPSYSGSAREWYVAEVERLRAENHGLWEAAADSVRLPSDEIGRLL